MPHDRFGSNGGHFDPGPHRPRGTNGSAPRGMDTRPIAFEDVEDPIDLVAVQADDELINALAAGMSVSSPGVGGYDADDRVAAILAAWKADVDSEPIPELVDVDTAVATVLAARPPSRRARHLVPVAAAAAFVVLAIGGLSVGSYNAQPDDVLWPITKVLYSERAGSVEAAVRVEERIANAKEALATGHPVVAAQELAQAEADLAKVRPEEGHTELAETQDFLSDKAAETPEGQPVDPGAPLATQPHRPVPSGAASPARPSPQGSTAPSSTGPQASPAPTSAPIRPSSPDGPENPGRPADPSADPRQIQVAPESGPVTATPTPDPRTEENTPAPEPTNSPSSTATPESAPEEPTTAPEGNGTPGSADGGADGGATGSTGATASSSGTESTTN